MSGVMTPALLTATALAGGVGAVCRYLLGTTITRWLRTRFPVGTVVVNISGSLLIGLLAGCVSAASLPPHWMLVVGTGFLGGYTTFSTSSYETVQLLLDGYWREALVNAFDLALLAIGAAALGFWLGARLF